MNVCINRSSLFIPCILFAGHIDSPELSVTFFCLCPETDSIHELSSTHGSGPINHPWPLFLLSNQLSWAFDNEPNILGWNAWEKKKFNLQITYRQLPHKGSHDSRTSMLPCEGAKGSLKCTLVRVSKIQ